MKFHILAVEVYILNHVLLDFVVEVIAIFLSPFIL